MMEDRTNQEQIPMEDGSCNLCGELNYRGFLTVKPWHLVQCKRCELVFLHPRPAVASLVGLYDDRYLMDLLSTAEEGVEWRLGWLGKFQRTSGELLEVGCGRGQLLIEAKKRGWSVRGVEISHAAVRRLRDEFDLEVLHGSLAEAGFPDSSFDVITSSHVLEHLPSPSSALREIHRILKAGGMLQVAVPNIRSFDFAINRQRWRGLHLPYHLYHFSPATLTKLLVKSGFRPIEVWPGITESIQKRIDRLLAIFDRLQAHAKNSRTGFESGEQPLDHSILTLWSSVKLLMKNILVRAFPGENLIAHGVKDR